MNNITCNILTSQHVEAYKNIRLELLKEHPDAFGSSFEEEASFEPAMWEKRISNNHVDSLGAFHNEELIGIAVLSRSPRSKMKHVASLHSMYVKKDNRHQGVAQLLIQEVFRVAQTYEIERINLSVVSTNHEAINLYTQLGFSIYGEEPETIKIDNRYKNLLLMTKRM